jgi:hypothetical protein
MLKFVFRWLEPEKIDLHEDTFRVRRRHPSSLAQSISRAGIRTPLLVQRLDPDGEVVRLVSGWGRLSFCGDVSTLPTFVLPSDLAAEEVWDLFLRDNERWNALEVARVLAALDALPGLESTRIVQEKLPALGLRPAFELYRKHLRLLELGERAQAFIENEELSLRRTAVFFNLSAESVEEVIDLAAEQRLTHGELSELLELLDEISHRDGLTVAELIAAARTALQGKGKGTRGQDKAKLRAYFQRRRFPELHRYRRSLEEYRRAIRSRVPFEVEWDPLLERPGVRLRVDLKDREALEAFLSDLEQNRDLLARFFEIL